MRYLLASRIHQNGAWRFATQEDFASPAPDGADRNVGGVERGQELDTIMIPRKRPDDLF